MTSFCVTNCITEGSFTQVPDFLPFLNMFPVMKHHDGAKRNTLFSVHVLCLCSPSQVCGKRSKMLFCSTCSFVPRWHGMFFVLILSASTSAMCASKFPVSSHNCFGYCLVPGTRCGYLPCTISLCPDGIFPMAESFKQPKSQVKVIVDYQKENTDGAFDL